MGIMINASAELRAGRMARTARASRSRRAHYLWWRIYWMCQSETNVWESSLLGLEFLLKWQIEFKTLLTFLVAFPVRRESVNAMYRVKINAWQMERFLNPMHLVHVSIWWRADKEHLERGCKAWEVIGQTVKWISSPSFPRSLQLEASYWLTRGDVRHTRPPRGELQHIQYCSICASLFSM